jgi:hypothetical protein
VKAAEDTSRKISIVISIQADEILRQLVFAGLYGMTREEVAERLLMERIREFVQFGPRKAK